MDVALIEYEGDVAAALAAFPPGCTLYVSLSAEASFALSERGVPYVADESLLATARFKEIGNENFRLTERWADVLDAALAAADESFPRRGFRPFSAHYYRLKILVDAVRVRSAALSALLDREMPARLGAPAACDPAAIRDHNLYFHRADSLYGMLAALAARERGIELSVWPAPSAPSSSSLPLRARVWRALKAKVSAAWLLRRSLGAPAKGGGLLGVFGYDIAPLAGALSSEFRFYLHDGDGGASALPPHAGRFGTGPVEPFPAVELDGRFVGVAATGESGLDAILGARVQAFAGRYLRELWDAARRLELADRDLEFSAYFHQAGASDAFAAIPVAHFASRGKPVFVVQHGAYGFALNRQTEYCEFGHDGRFLAWGDGVRAQYEPRKKGACEIVTTGSALIEGIRARRRRVGLIRKICFVGHLFRRYTSYYPNGQPSLDSELFPQTCRLLTALKPYAGRYEITYKLDPGEARPSSLTGANPLPRWIAEHAPEIMVETWPLPDMIHGFDLFVIDWPSTSLVQAAASGAEILAYLGNQYFVLEDGAREALGRRAQLAGDEKEFGARLEALLGKGLPVSDLDDMSFLESYGVARDDGKCLERLARAARGPMRRQRGAISPAT